MNGLSLINACLSQLIQGTVKPIGWISDGSASKVYFGKVQSVEIGDRGLIIVVLQDSGRLARVSWRMTREDAFRIVYRYYRSAIFVGSKMVRLSADIHEPRWTEWQFDRLGRFVDGFCRYCPETAKDCGLPETDSWMLYRLSAV